MRLLFRIAFKNQKHKLLLIITMISMCLLTLATQLEIFALGVITKKGPDFFELFAPIENQKLQRADIVYREAIEDRWDQIDEENKGFITKLEAVDYLSKWKSANFIDQVIAKLDNVFAIDGNIKNLALMIVVIAIFKAIMLFTQRFTTRLAAIRVSRDLRQDYFEHIQSLSMSFYQQHNIGSLSARVVGDAALIAEAVNATLVNYLQTPYTVLTTLTLCFLTSWKLSLIIFFGFPCIVFPIVFLAHRVKRISKQIQNNQERFSSVLIDFLTGIQTVKMFAMEDFSLKKYREQNHKMATLEQRSARYDLSSRPVVHTIGMFFLAGVLIYGIYVLGMSVSEVLFYGGLLWVFYEPIKKFAEENSHIQRGISAAERMYEVLELEPQIQDDAQAFELTAFQNEIEFDHVWFKYEDEWILKDLSFTVPKGKTVAIVGPTGGGKSTIVQLLPRLYDVQQGDIRIDGKSIKLYKQKSLRENIAFVPQKPFLFLDTIYANIAFGRDFSQEEVYEAARQAHADEFITELPKGYDTELSDAGKNLSGGQQQRLAIARALVKKASILVMDEATSSLDPISENRIKLAINELRGEVTQIIIAHRLSTIEDADKIIYMEKGRKIAEGTKDELLEICPNFRLMWEILHRGNDASTEFLLASMR
jgi:ABC-type multidrug transport system fused ATPase/permease subunit